MSPLSQTLTLVVSHLKLSTLKIRSRQIVRGFYPKKQGFLHEKLVRGFYPKNRFSSASHADSSFVGVSDVGPWYSNTVQGCLA